MKNKTKMMKKKKKQQPRRQIGFLLVKCLQGSKLMAQQVDCFLVHLSGKQKPTGNIGSVKQYVHKWADQTYLAVFN